MHQVISSLQEHLKGSCSLPKSPGPSPEAFCFAFGCFSCQFTGASHWLIWGQQIYMCIGPARQINHFCKQVNFYSPQYILETGSFTVAMMVSETRKNKSKLYWNFLTFFFPSLALQPTLCGKICLSVLPNICFLALSEVPRGRRRGQEGKWGYRWQKYALRTGIGH